MNTVGNLLAKYESSFSSAVDTDKHLYDRIDTEALDAFPLADFRFKYCSLGNQFSNRS
jgi:hypothetical protein